MSVATSQLLTGRRLVGLVPVPLSLDPIRLYHGVSLRAHPGNTSPIAIANRACVQTAGPLAGYWLPPGWGIDNMPIDSLALWAISDDVFQILDWWGL